MSQVNPYASIEKRTFGSALMHLLETEYGLLGGRRILRLLVEDVEALLEEFYPRSERASSGTLVWTCTADEGQKAEPGKRTEAYKATTVQLPLVTTEDLQERTERKLPRSKRLSAARERDKKRLGRLVKAMAEQGGLLTLAELSVMLDKSYQVISTYVREWEEENGELLPLKGYKMDQDSRPTHKKMVMRLYEQGLEPPGIARETRHNLKSVEQYLQDYQRVRMLLQQRMAVDEISSAIGRGRSVVLVQLRKTDLDFFQHERCCLIPQQVVAIEFMSAICSTNGVNSCAAQNQVLSCERAIEYVEIVRQYHPELVKEPELEKYGDEDRCPN